MESEKANFLKRINQTSGRKIRDLSECWLWNWGVHTSGYAQYQSNWAKENKVVYAHQAAYKLFKDSSYKPSREHPCSHICESPDDYKHRLCVNPEHLYIANSIAENVADRDRNRGSYQSIKTAGCKGTNANFSEDDIKNILKLREEGKYYKEIAEQYNSNRRTIERICLGRTYKAEVANATQD
jgi:hypothetical protein